MSPEAGVNDVLAVEGHWLGRHFALTYDKGRTIPLVPLTLHRRMIAVVDVELKGRMLTKLYV